MELLTANTTLSKEDMLTAKQKESFAEQANIKTVLLKEGDRIWRFIDNPDAYRSAYWGDTSSLQSIYATVYDRLNQWDFGDKSPNGFKDVIYSQNAICKTWDRTNNFYYFIEARVKKSVVGYYGKIKFQHTFTKDETGKYSERILESQLGGGKQIVIPRFAPENTNVDLKTFLIYNIKKVEQSSWFKGNAQSFR